MLRILLNFPSSHVRLALRIYFNVILPFLGVVGDQCCRKRTQLKLLRGSNIDVTQTTGWLRGTTAVYVLYALRRSPAGWLGVIMILSGVMWLLADLVVSGFVVTVNVVDRCPFNTTSYVVIGIPDENKIGPFSTGNVGAPWDIITRAVETNQINGGMDGIFHKVNTDLSFRADEQDLIGGWQCQHVGQDARYIPREDPNVIAKDLFSRDLLYESNTGCATQFIGHNWYVQLAMWSSSVGDWQNQLAGQSEGQIINSTVSEQWDVRAAIDLSKNPEDDKIMRSYQCTMNATSLERVRGKLQAATTLATFCENMRSNVYRYLTANVTMSEDPGSAIAKTLNIIMMMASARNAGTMNPPPPVDDPFQGCIAPKTVIPLEVTVTWLTITIGAIGLCVYWLILTVEIVGQKRKSSYTGESLISTAPNGLLGWILQAVKTTGIERDPKYAGLSSWVLQPSYNQSVLQLAHKSDVPNSAQHGAAMVNPHPAAIVTPLLAEPEIKRPHTIKRRPVSSYHELPRGPEEPQGNRDGQI
jgi:hypothetical protein